MASVVGLIPSRGIELFTFPQNAVLSFATQHDISWKYSREGETGISKHEVPTQAVFVKLRKY